MRAGGAHKLSRFDKSEKKILCGSQAVARGAFEAGAKLAVGYPGTPTTPAIAYLLENHSSDLRSEWSINEKIAIEIAAGHSWAGQSSFAAFKMSSFSEQKSIRSWPSRNWGPTIPVSSIAASSGVLKITISHRAVISEIVVAVFRPEIRTSCPDWTKKS